MMRPLAYIAFVVLAGAAFPQSPEPRPIFEVADVQAAPLNPNRFGRSGTLHGSRYEFKNATMVDLISTAYGVDEDKVLGGPTWMEMDRFDVIAKAPANSTPDALKLMLQSLLADRFKLVARAETKPLPAFALRAGKHLLIKQADGSEETGCKQSIEGLPKGPMEGPINVSSLTLAMSCHNMTTAAFVERMPIPRQGPGGSIKPVLDQTELKGGWNFDFKFAMEGFTDSVPISADLEKQLGLKLDTVMIPLPVVQV